MRMKMENAKKILVVPDDRVDIDLIASSISIAKTLENQGKDVKILLSEKNYPGFMTEIIPPKGLTFLEPENSKNYVVRLKNQNAKVSDIKWKQKNGELNIFITTNRGKIQYKDSNIEISHEDFDLVILVGVNHPKRIGKYYDYYKDLFTKEKTIILNFSSSFNSKYKYIRASSSSLSEISYQFLNSINYHISPDLLTILLTGIYWKTNNFQDYIHSSNIFNLASELLEKGAEVEIAAKKSNQILKKNEIKLVNKILSNYRITKDNIAISKVWFETMSDIEPGKIVFKNWNLLRFISGVKLSLVLLEGKEEIFVYIFSNTKSIDATKLAQEFSGVGDRQKISFRSKKSIDDLESELLLKVSSYLNGESESDRLSHELSKHQDLTNPTKSQTKPKEKIFQTEKEFSQQEEKPPKTPSYNSNSQNVQSGSLDNSGQNKTSSTPKNESFSSQETNYDPLAPATSFPEPIRTEKPQKKKNVGPLPEAER